MSSPKASWLYTSHLKALSIKCIVMLHGVKFNNETDKHNPYIHAHSKYTTIGGKMPQFRRFFFFFCLIRYNFSTSKH